MKRNRDPARAATGVVSATEEGHQHVPAQQSDCRCYTQWMHPHVMDFDLDDALARGATDEIVAWARSMACNAAERVAALGRWPSWIDAVDTLVSRVPLADAKRPGFDAGLACALDLIPRNRQQLSAELHANFSRKAVHRVRRELRKDNLDPSDEGVWWLAACHVCREDGVSVAEFSGQLALFKSLSLNETARLEAASKKFQSMVRSFDMTRGFPLGQQDGCILGAYLSGYLVGVEYALESGEYYIGTLMPSLGLEKFRWSCDPGSESCRSGPIAGSRQFVRCANEVEFELALERVRSTFARRSWSLDRRLG